MTKVADRVGQLLAEMVEVMGQDVTLAAVSFICNGCGKTEGILSRDGSELAVKDFEEGFAGWMLGEHGTDADYCQACVLEAATWVQGGHDDA